MIPIDINLLKIKEARENHINQLVCEIKKKLDDNGENVFTDYFTQDLIKRILGDNPKKLYQLHLLTLKTFIADFNLNQLCDFYKAIDAKKDKENYTVKEKEIDDLFGQMTTFFDYNRFQDKKKNKYDLYDLASKLDIPTCVYCNRMYTKTVIDDDGNKITRPTFDHWFPKSKYPLLSISFYNLIPSCTVCNSTIKGSKDVSLENEFHPYYTHVDNSKKLEYSFNYDHKDYNNFKFKIKTSNKFSKDSVDAYALEEIYKAHEDEIEDLRRIKDAYTESYLESIEKHILKHNISREEIYRFAFGTHFEDAMHDKRPLSKMKKDILIELGIIKPDSK